MVDSPTLTRALEPFRAPRGRVNPVLQLAHMRRAMKALGDPQNAIPRAIHITGTNGKGSTAAYVRAMAEACGCRVHVFTSPHLVRVNERIRVASKLVEDDALIAALDEVAHAQRNLTYFEALAAAAFLMFARTPADLSIIEVGAGGATDATNVMARPAATCVTPVSLDHETLFGVKGVAAIARLKAGIFREGAPAIISEQPTIAQGVLIEEARKVGALAFAAGRGWRAGWDKQAFVYEGADLRVRTPWLALPGRHQAQNAGAACAIVERLGDKRFEPELLAAGLREASWPGRLQRLRPGPMVDAAGGDAWGGAIIIDAAHNPAGIASLAAAVRAGRPQLGSDKATAIFACQAVKDIPAMIAALAADVDEVIAVQLPESGGQEGAGGATPQAIVSEVMSHRVPALSAPDIASAVRLAAQRGAHRIYVTGSIYLCGAALAANGESVI